MSLFHSILTFMKDLYQSENQVFNPTRLLVLLHCWVGKDWTGPFFGPPPPPKSFDLSIDLLVFRFMLLFHSFLTFMKDLYQSEHQSSFQSNKIIGTSTKRDQVFKPTRVGKDWAFYLSSRPILSPKPTSPKSLLRFFLLISENSLYWYFYIGFLSPPLCYSFTLF